MLTINISTDEDTLDLLECVKRVLTCYYEYSEETALKYIEKFHSTFDVQQGWDDYRYHHEGAIRVAAIIHLHLHLDVPLKGVLYEQEEIYAPNIEFLYSKQDIYSKYIQCYGEKAFVRDRNNVRLC